MGSETGKQSEESWGQEWEMMMGQESNRSKSRLEAGPYTPVQFLFLLRLARLLRERREYDNLLSPDDWRMKLLNRAIYSTFCDTRDQGLAGDARALFERDKTVWG